MRNKRGKEIWKAISGYPAYSISSHGRVKSYKVLKPYCGIYRTIGLSKNNKRKTHRIPRLVALHFIKNPKRKPEVNHKNGNKWDDYYKNLEWATAKENSAHRSAVLNKRYSFLNIKQVTKLRKLAGTMPQRKIAAVIGTSLSTVNKIINRKYWKHI
jgi:hypothetical protein